MTHFSSHFFDVHHGMSDKKKADVQASKPAKAIFGIALLIAISVGFYSLNTKTDVEKPLAKTSVAHVRPAWH